MKSYYTFFDAYERAQNYINRGVAPEINKTNIQNLELNYPEFFETYKNDKENNTKSDDRLTPEEEARIADEKAKVAETQAKAAAAAERLKEERKTNPWAGTGADAPGGYFP